MLILTIGIVSLLTVSAVSATDNATDDVVSSEYDENMAIQDNQSESIITFENDEIDTTESIDEDIVNDNPGTFRDLAIDVSNGEKLDKDYIKTNTWLNYITGSKIMDGNGHTIDLNNYYESGLRFGSNFTVKNCNFVNGGYVMRGDDTARQAEKYIYNCNFTNCGLINFIAPKDGWTTEDNHCEFKLVVKNCNFIGKCAILSTFSYTRPVLFYDITFENCTFSNSKDGVINICYGDCSIWNTTININNCLFINNSNKNGGVINISRTVSSSSMLTILNINNSTFINNSAQDIGGVIYLNSDNLNINNSRFISNSAIKGATIYSTPSQGTIRQLDRSIIINNTLFLGNSGVLDDGIYINSTPGLVDSHINNCILLSSEYGNNPIIYSEEEIDGDYNWWGNTFDNPKQKPSGVNKLIVRNWLILNITSIADSLYLGDIVPIKCNLSSVMDYTGNLKSYYYSNELNMSFVAESLGVLDEFSFVGGFGKYDFTLNNVPISTLIIKCANFQKIINFNVNKKMDITINVPDSCNNEKKLIIDLPTNATGNITVIINNKNYTSTINEGKAVIDLSELENGTYGYEIIYSGNRIFLPFQNTGNIKIGHISTIKANDMIITYGEQVYFTATFYESNGSPLINKYVAFKINNDEKPIKTDSNGTARLPIELNIGEYNITSINDYTGESITNKLVVKAADPKPINENQIIIPSLDSGSGTIKLPSDANGIITLDFAGKTYNFNVTDGVCDVKLPELTNGAYGYILTYSGDAKYSSFTKTGSFTINNPINQDIPSNPSTPANPSKPIASTKPVAKTTLTLKKVKVKKSAKKLVLQATLKQGKKPLYKVKITFKFNGKKYTAKTNKKGIAKVTITKKVLKKLKVGKKVKYQASYGKKTVKKTVKVKK